MGSVSRESAAEDLPFLEHGYRGRRAAIREVTHLCPELVFWISPSGEFIDARDGHLANPPKGRADILEDEPDYGGFLRGRVASYAGTQFVVVYCRADALVEGDAVTQFADGLARFPVPVAGSTLVISDNGDIYGTVEDVVGRVAK